MAEKSNLKVISFPDFKKKVESKKKREEIWNKIKSFFKIKRGFEKYRIVRWGNYTDTNGGWVEVQNLTTGKLQHIQLGVLDVSWETVELFVSKLK